MYLRNAAIYESSAGVCALWFAAHRAAGNRGELLCLFRTSWKFRPCFEFSARWCRRFSMFLEAETSVVARFFFCELEEALLLHATFFKTLQIRHPS